MDPKSSVLFSSSLAGNPVGPVDTGFAAFWKALQSDCAEIFPYLRRNVVDDVDFYYSDDDVAFAESATSHKDISNPWSEGFELPHGHVHLTFGLGSHMANILCSPTDPMFFLHHTFVDNLFERFRNNVLKNNTNIEYVDVSQLPDNFNDSGQVVQVYSAGES